MQSREDGRGGGPPLTLAAKYPDGGPPACRPARNASAPLGRLSSLPQGAGSKRAVSPDGGRARPRAARARRLAVRAEVGRLPRRARERRRRARAVEPQRAPAPALLPGA